MNSLETAQFVIHVIYVVFIVCGNTLTLIVLHINRHWQTPSGLLIGNLAVTDALLGCVVLPFGFRPLIVGTWDTGRALCSISGFTTQVIGIVAILTLTLISLDRYIAIIHALKYQMTVTVSKTSIIIAVVWFIAITTSSLPFLDFGQFVYAHGKKTCVADYRNNAVFTWFIFSVALILPMLVTLFCYVNIFLAVRRQQEAIRLNSVAPHQINGGPQRDQIRRFKQESRLAVVMFVILGLFFTSLGTFTIYNLYSMYTRTQSDLGDFLAAKIVCLNAVLNPLIYGVMNKSFRAGYYKILYMLVKCRNPPITYTENAPQSNT